MTVVLIVFLILILPTIRIGKYNKDYLSIEYTNSIKGFFLFFVFLRHFFQYDLAFNSVTFDVLGKSIGLDKIAQYLDSHGGQLLVTMFLFYSGYGVMESFKRKGEAYVKAIPKKRMLSTLINFDIAVLVYIIVYKFYFSGELTVSKVIGTLVGWDSVGNSNWYIFCIIICYFITYLSLQAFDKNKAVVSITAGILLFTVAMSFYKPSYWYNTAFCYALGCAYSVNKDRIEEWLKKKELLVFSYAFLLFVIASELKGTIFWYHIYTLTFVVMIMILTRKVSLKNKLLSWLGKNLFPLYIFQRLPMMLLKDIPVMHDNPWLFFIVVLALTAVIAVVYNFIMSAKGKLAGKAKKA